MKRMHIHVGVEHLDQGIKFYSALFGAQPIKTKTDYAKWMLDDPRVNFAISTRAEDAGRGIRHLGIQAEDMGELGEVFSEAGVVATREQLQSMLGTGDGDGSGTLAFSEFKALMLRAREEGLEALVNAGGAQGTKRKMRKKTTK